MCAMQIVTPGPFPGSVDDEAAVPLGTTAQDELGNTYIYLQGIGSTAVGLAVTWNLSTYVTALGGTTTVGPIAFATAAVLANQFGWYLIYGRGAAVSASAVDIGDLLQLAASGTVDDTTTSGDLIYNCWCCTTRGDGGAIEVFVQYPFATQGQT